MKIKFVRVALAVSVLGSVPFAHAGSAPPGQPGMIRRLVQKVKAHFGAKSAPTTPEPESLSMEWIRTVGISSQVLARARSQEPSVAPAAPAMPVQAPARMVVEGPKQVVAPPLSVIAPPVVITPSRVATTAPASKPVFAPRPAPSFYRWEEPVTAKLGYEQLDATARAPIDELLRQVERPTVAQLMKTVRAAYGGKLPTENPFGGASHVKHESTLIADMVAQLEHAFPGGHYLPLGRDAVLIADALEGFYTAIGQTGRVKRLDMSGLSLPHYRNAHPGTYEEDRPIIHDFLKSNGLDLANATKKAPYIMIDVTSYGETSQSTQLVRSVYRTWVKDLGGDPKALYDHVNFVGTPMGGPVTFISDHKNIDAVKDRLRSQTGTDGPRELLYLGGNMSRLTYTSSWHSDFVKMERQSNGTVTAQPGRQSSLGSKQEVLAELFEVEALTSKPEFLDQVRRIAVEKYGYEFPMKQTEHLKRLASPASPAPVERASKEPVTVATATTASKEDSGFIKSMRLRLPKAPNKPEVAQDFLTDLAGMWARKSFSPAEARSAIREIHKYVDLRSSEMRQPIIEVVAAYPAFRSVIDKALKTKKN